MLDKDNMNVARRIIAGTPLSERNATRTVKEILAALGYK